MKRLIPLLVLGFAACRATEERIDPSASYPDVKTGNLLEGELVVDLGTTGFPRKGSVTPLYTVYDADGRKVKVSSTASTTLEPGRYLIRLEDPVWEPDIFWVTVEEGKTTYVDPARLGGRHPAYVQ